MASCANIFQKSNIVATSYKHNNAEPNSITKIKEEFNTSEFANPEKNSPFSPMHEVHIFALMAHLAYSTQNKAPNQCTKQLLPDWGWSAYNKNGYRTNPIGLDKLRAMKPMPWNDTRHIMNNWVYLPKFSFSLDYGNEAFNRPPQEGGFVKAKLTTALNKSKTPIKSLVSGLTYDVWYDQSNKNFDRYAIAFRGTDFSSWPDWISNFRWMLQTANRWDQYDQVEAIIPTLVDSLIKKSGKLNKPTKIIATGHSLGGGLAQKASYSSSKISQVVVFDTTPVTDFNKTKDGSSNSKDHNIFRVHESGEVLGLLRPITELASRLVYWKYGVNNPKILHVRYNAIPPGNPITALVDNHDVGELACALFRFKEL